MKDKKTETRIYFLDSMRVIACFMVIVVHSCEFFFIDGEAIGIRSLDDGWWVSVVDSAFRCSVPLFVMISAYLLVPVKGDAGVFFKRRLTRVVVPFAVWSLLYAVLPCLWGAASGQEAASSILRLLYNFNGSSGHLWFIYMLVGLYLFMPVLSPWLEKAGKRAERLFLVLWFASTFFPYLRDRLGAVYGECYWNEFNMLWYFSGFLGYVVLAHYIRHHLAWSPARRMVLGSLMYLVGYAVTAVIWYHRIPVATTLQELELSWRFCTPNVVLMSFGAFVVIQSLSGKRQQPGKLVTEVSSLSYGVYLMHIFVLNAVYMLIGGMWSTPLTILSVGVLTFVACILLAKVLSLLPCGKYLVG